MQEKLLKDIFVAIAGPSASGLVDLLYGKKNVNEFVIAKKLNLNVNQARNILYKLSENGLVSFTKKKDKSNSGWYTYFWTINVGRSMEVLKNELQKQITVLENNLGIRQKQRFYYCVNCDVELDEENALVNNFICPECGEVLQLRDNSDIIKETEKGIAKLREQIDVVSTEIDKIDKKDHGVRLRKLKSEKKKKASERAAKKAAKEAEKKKQEKPKKVKKVPKKSVKKPAAKKRAKKK